MIYPFRYIARITVEAETPLAVGSGEKGLLTDKLVAKDANFLPYIPGTSLAGVLRHSFDDTLANKIFGSGGDDGEGSRLMVSSAMLVGEDGKEVVEGLKKLDYNNGYYSYFTRLPERDHVRMTDKGAADSKNHGKYDEELVHKGVRFVFELEYFSNSEFDENWDSLLNALSHPRFRVGGGTRKGFGKLKIVSEQSHRRCFKLSCENDFSAYLNQTGSLNYETKDWGSFNKMEDQSTGWQLYKLKVQPKDYFIFGAGYGDQEADSIPKTEKYFEWHSGKPELIQQDALLIPASSIKGIISHRVAYHYNLLSGVSIQNVSSYIELPSLDAIEAVNKLSLLDIDIGTLQDPDDPRWQEIEEQISKASLDSITEFQDLKRQLDEFMLESTNPHAGEQNPAVKILFGYSKNTDNKIEGQRGRVLINDVYLPVITNEEKVFNHVKIDRFTGGASDGALFQEKATRYKEPIIIDIWVENTAFEGDVKIKEAFESALKDIVEGSLPLGGHSSKGHGIFNGSFEIK